MTKRLPPLNPLRTFEVAAHCHSFTEAAQELGVTQAAVSRQIAVLEGFFKTKLFERDVRTIRLTAVGLQLYRDTSGAFDRIRAATERALRDGKLVRVQTYPTFAAKWLMPRLNDFMLKHPDVDLMVEVGIRPADFARSDNDIAIQFGEGDWANVHMHRLFRDQIAPVCSPRLLERDTLKTPSDLIRFTLLNAKYRNRDWTEWLTASGGPPFDELKKLTFESSMLAYQAAVEGLGIAMGQVHLLQQEIDRGQLVRPFAKTLLRNLHYWMILPADRRLSPETRRFVNWLLAYAESDNADLDPRHIFPSSQDSAVRVN